MSSVNKVILIGNLGRDPEIQSFNNGGRAALLSVATSEKWKDKNTGEPREKTEWHRVVIYPESTVGFVERNLKKGSKIYIEGSNETRKWTDKEGKERYTTEVIVRPYRGSLELLDRREGGGSQGEDANQAPRGNGGQGNSRGGYGQGNGQGGGQGGGQNRGGYGGQGGGYGGGQGGGNGQGNRGNNRSGGSFDDEIPF